MNKSYKTLPLEKNFLAIEKEYSGYDNSKVVILSAPYEKTTSYGKGTAKGPKAILEASHYVEFFDEETEKQVCFDIGIAAIEPMQFSNNTGKKALDLIYKNVNEHIKNGKFVITLGGEHSISTAPIQAHFDNYSDLSILHFDAHSDLREEYEGSKYSHASFAARVAEFTADITQVGIRAQCKEEFEFIKAKGIKTFYAHQMRNEGFNQILIEKILQTLKKNVYITFDVDYFDPSIMPSTGTPEPNGFYWDETMRLLKKVCAERNLVGFDVVELAPRKDYSFPDFMTAKLIYKILNYKF
ncbi:MAG TPA: agmatinase [Ignavibacteria bacterium]|nr:agmatinase [Bacteroidota bacterium]HRE10686.1 agmatinase [Ignavibacteria bacterium]HRF66780.1 agmatinase [Ignavibacteria bacterium]HRJ04402.1 agmatinase [Ignavibacteria bacterium]HRJ84988.1 agmatinase [Ignavibacteria bacterium]